MNSNIAAALVLAALLGACSDSPSDKVAGGGFETSDIQATLKDSLGRTIVGARVWLVRNNADSLPSPQTLDSATSDEQGRVKVGTADAGKGSLSMEAWVGDTLVGFAPRIDANTPPPFPFRMHRTRVLTLPCAPTPYMVILPGSQFWQPQPPMCRDSFYVLLPPGKWNLYKTNMFAPPNPVPLGRETDSLPMWVPPPRTDGGPLKPGPYPPPYQPVKR